MGDYSLEEVSKHNREDSCWIVVNGDVYDVTQFLATHPGGRKVLLRVGGKDASKEFAQFHDASMVLPKHAALRIGRLSTSGSSPAPSSRPDQRAEKVVAVSNDASGLSPYGDPAWYGQKWNTVYYTDSHRRFREAVRAFMQKEVQPYVHEWDEARTTPAELRRKAFEAGILPGVVGVPWPTEYVGRTIAGGVTPEEYDQFHELILMEEVANSASGGLTWGLIEGLAIGLPPVLHFGSKELKDRVVGPCLRGEKVICLCITEPTGGSDVANLTCEAKLTADGKHFVVNGEKKWITNGVWADYFTVACRTGGKGMGGVSLLLIERSFGGVQTRPMACQGVWASGTTYITFEDVKVPVGNLIGKLNEGFKPIMYNFNHERWGIIAQALAFARVCLNDAWQYALKRKTFGKSLMQHPVIRMKLAHMAREVEASHAWLEYITYQLKTMSHEDASAKLASSIALLKVQSTVLFERCAREATQIFGGLAYTRTGQGERVERLYRDVRAYAIGGGSEEIMTDLGVRRAQQH